MPSSPRTSTYSKVPGTHATRSRAEGRGRNTIWPSSHPQAELAEAGEDLLLHLAGHAGLTAPMPGGGVGVGVGGEGPVDRGRLAVAEARAHVLIGRDQRLDRRARFTVGDRAFDGLLDREQELGHHVPVDAPQPLVGEERPGPPGELRVGEHLLEDVEQLGATCLRHLAQIRIRREPVKDLLHVADIADACGEVQVSAHIGDHEAAVPRRDQGGDQRAGLRPDWPGTCCDRGSPQGPCPGTACSCAGPRGTGRWPAGRRAGRGTPAPPARHWTAPRPGPRASRAVAGSERHRRTGRGCCTSGRGHPSRRFASRLASM